MTKILRSTADLVSSGRFPPFSRVREVVRRRGKDCVVERVLPESRVRARLSRFVDLWRGAVVEEVGNRLHLTLGRATCTLLLEPGAPPGDKRPAFLGVYGRGLEFTRAGSTGYSVARRGGMSVLLVATDLLPFEPGEGDDPGIGSLLGVPASRFLRSVEPGSVAGTGSGRVARLLDRAYPAAPLEFAAPASVGFTGSGVAVLRRSGRVVAAVSPLEGTVGDRWVDEEAGSDFPFPDLLVGSKRLLAE